MFAKSKQIGLVSLFVVLGATIGGCAESVGSEPASFPSQGRPVAFMNRTLPASEVFDERATSTNVQVASSSSALSEKRSARSASAR